MTAVVLVALTGMRRQWRGVVVVTLLIGIAGAVVLAAAAGARQTSTSLERFRSDSRSADVELDVDQATEEQLAALRRNPAVAGVGRLRQLNLVLPNGENLPTAVAVDGTFGTVVDRPRVIEGRLPRPTSVREVAIGESLASKLHLRVGDRATFESYSVQQTEQAIAGRAPRTPRGPKVRFDIVGLVRRPLDLGVLGGFGGIVVPTPAFHERYRDEIGSFVSDLLRVRAKQGATDVPQVVTAGRAIFGDSLFSVVGVGTETEGARDAIDVLTAALWIFAGVAALAGITAVGIVTFRQIGTVERDQEMLAALGLTARQRAFSAGALVLPAAIGGGVLAVAGAALLSPLLPFGLARKAEVDLGFRIDTLVLGSGLLGVVSFVLLVAAAAAWRVARSVARGRDALAVRRPSAAARSAASAGAPPTVTTGLRMALEPGRGPTAVPVRSAFLGAAVGTLGIAAVLVVSASLDHLAATPRLYGWSWDTVVSTREDEAGNTEVCGDVATDVTRDPVFAAVESICLEAVEVDGHPVTGWAFTALRGSIEPAIVEGHAPRGPDEVALGAVALEAIDKRIGDTVQLRGERAKRFRVVGQVVLPTTDAEFPEPLADAAALTGTGLARIYGPISVPNLSLVAKFAEGVDPGRLPQTASGQWKFESGLGLRPRVPVEIDRLRQVDHLPAILGGLLGLLATVAVAHAIVLATRRRRRDLAVLRTIGFKRRDVRATIAYQATTLALLGLLVGVPAGVAVGHAVWRLIADGLGVTAATDVSALALAVVAVAALLVVNIIGGIAAAAAIRDRPAVVLSEE